MASSKGKMPIRDDLPTARILFPIVDIPGGGTGVDTWGVDPALVTHRGIFCKGPLCRDETEPIRGTRYKCSKCPNIDFDDACMRSPQNIHNRSHEFWPCYGEAFFEDQRYMGPEELRELQETAGDIPGEYVVVSQQDAQRSSGVASQADAFDLEQLRVQLFGKDNHLPDDLLLAHWKAGTPAVRLIALLPGDPHDGLECYFISTRLDEPEPYDALCCDWIPGAENSQLDPTDEIYIVQQFIEIRKATGDALRALRSTKHVLNLWVEELCVQNQHPEFKAFQERSTSLVHNRAARTIIWAGKADERTEAACMLVEMLSYRCEREDGTLPSPTEIETDEDMDALGLLPVGSAVWRSLLQFFPPHLFTQGWLLHDVAFASNPIVKCGDYEPTWRQVAKVRDMLAQPVWMALDWRLQAYDESGFEDVGL